VVEALVAVLVKENIFESISRVLVCVWDIEKWPLVLSFIDFVSKAMSNSLELPLLYVINLFLPFISRVHFHILFSTLRIECLFLFCDVPYFFYFYYDLVKWLSYYLYFFILNLLHRRECGKVSHHIMSHHVTW